MSVFKRVILMLFVPLFAIGFGLAWYGMTARFVTTDNAYVKTDIISISSNIDGRAHSIHIENNQFVRKDQVLFSLDDETHKISVSKSKAKLDSVLLHIRSLRSRYQQALSEIGHAQQQLEFRQKQLRRQQDLADRNVGSVATLDNAIHELKIAERNLLMSNESAQQVLTELGGDIDRPAKTHPMYLEEITAYKQARLLLKDTKIIAPADGVVTRMNLQPGEWVEKGRPVFSLVDKQKQWIEANLKETQLTHVKVGQSVKIHIDAYPSTTWQGSVKHISAAMGSEFMILPPQNATGNWIKVVQRIPVHIDIDGQTDKAPLPRAGMTSTITIDTEIEGAMASWLRRHFSRFFQSIERQ